MNKSIKLSENNTTEIGGLVKPDIPVEAISISSKEVKLHLSVAGEMAWIQRKSDERHARHEAKKAEGWKFCFDPNYFYNPTLAQFKVKVNALYPEK